MKINEKNLAAFASSSEQIDREGYLMKKGDGSRSYLRRWFVLKGNLLFYFDKKTDREPIGLIILEGSTIELADSESDEQFCFKIVFPSKSYVLGAESHEIMEQWMKALACASYDYVKLMAAELQRQLDDLSTEEACSAAGGPGPGISQIYSHSIQIDGNKTKNEYQQRLPSVPTPPPRTRNSKNQKSKEVRRSFQHLHEEYGTNILFDQQRRWSTLRTPSSAPLSLSKESTLIEL